MVTYTIEIKQMSIIVRLGKLKGARKFMRGDGLEFYVLGKVQHRRDVIINLCINKAIEHGHRAIDVRWWDYIK